MYVLGCGKKEVALRLCGSAAVKPVMMVTGKRRVGGLAGILRLCFAAQHICIKTRIFGINNGLIETLLQ
jgi:hypothetical protein